MKLAIAYSTKDQVELTKQTCSALNSVYDSFWCDGSVTEEGRALPEQYGHRAARVLGGADAAIAWKLSKTLASPENYTHIGLLENDVLLDPDWFEPTMELFEKGKQDGLEVGAVSARSYVDRVLIQREGYAVMHNLGAGMVIFTRDAARAVLRSFRTHWWPDNRRLFAQLSGIDLATYAAFRGQEQWVTTDWGWEAQLARIGLASIACTPARCQMVGQNPSLAQQGLELTPAGYSSPMFQNPEAFDRYLDNLDRLRADQHYELPGMIHREGAGMLIFPHQLGAINSNWNGWKLKWSQGFGPFAYRAGPGGASLSVHISGPCSFLATGGDAGAGVTIEDHRSGFRFSPELPAGDTPISVSVPGGPIQRQITADFSEGAVFYGLSCAEPQLIDTRWEFDWSQLPEAV